MTHHWWWSWDFFAGYLVGRFIAAITEARMDAIARWLASTYTRVTRPAPR